MKKVLAFGAFDGMHKGHEYFLGEAARLGELYVVVAKDVTVQKFKGKKTRYNENQRAEMIERKNIAKSVIIGESKDYYKHIRDLRPDIVCLGYDQIHLVGNISSVLKEEKIDARIIRIGSFHPELYKSSIINDDRVNNY